MKRAALGRQGLIACLPLVDRLTLRTPYAPLEDSKVGKE